MKANNGSGNIESRDDWETPNILWNKLNNQYNFNFDCCANKNNNKCNTFSANFQKILFDNLLKFDVCFMNPPFSKAKELFEHFFKVVSKGVAIYRCDNMETKIWQEIILKKADWIFIFNKRINYKGKQGKGSRFPSALIGIGTKPPKNLEGTTLKNFKW